MPLLEGSVETSITTVTTPPQYYTAPSDTELRAKPPLPTLPAINNIFTDPTFGSQIVRVTDANSGIQPGLAFTTINKIESASFSSDSTKFIFRDSYGSTYVYSFNPNTLVCTNFYPGTFRFPEGVNQFNFRPFFWDRNNPNLLIGKREESVGSFNIATEQYTELFNLRANYPSFVMSGISIVQGNQYIGVLFDGQQDTWKKFLVFNPWTGDQKLFDLTSSTINGVPTNIDLSYGTGMHNGAISPEDTWAEIGGYPFTWDYFTWWTISSSVITQTQTTGGHWTWGHGHYFGQRNDGDARKHGESVIIPTTGSFMILTPPNLLVSEQSDMTAYVSWRNSRADTVLPCFLVLTRGKKYELETLVGDEITAVRTDRLELRTWRFCHHRSFGHLGYYSRAKAHIDPTGRFCLFHSNWEATLGMDTNPNVTQPRIEVFLMKCV